MAAKSPIALILVLFICFAMVPAPGAAIQGTVSGEVVDETGAPLAGVVVTLREVESGKEVTAETNRKGRFKMAVLDSTGDFVIRLEKPGYATVEGPFDLLVGDTTRQGWVLLSEAAAAQQQAQSEELEAIKGRNLAAQLYNEGVKAYNEGDHDTALEQFKLAVEESPDLALAHGAMVQIYLARKDYESAVAAAERFRELAPDEPFGRQALYEAYWGMGDEEKSRALLEELIAEDPGRETAVRVFNVGVHEAKKGDLEAALEMFAKTLEIDPTLTLAELNIAQMHLSLGRHAEAAASATRYLATDEANPQALELLYRAQLELDDPAAAETFRRLTAADASFATGKYFEEGVELFNAGQPQEAIKVFGRVLETEPDNVRANYYLGLSHASAGDNAKARQYLSRFLELAPDDPEAESAREMIGYLE